MCQERLECVNDFREKIMLINVAEINANINEREFLKFALISWRVNFL